MGQYNLINYLLFLIASILAILMYFNIRTYLKRIYANTHLTVAFTSKDFASKIGAIISVEKEPEQPEEESKTCSCCKKEDKQPEIKETILKEKPVKKQYESSRYKRAQWGHFGFTQTKYFYWQAGVNTKVRSVASPISARTIASRINRYLNDKAKFLGTDKTFLGNKNDYIFIKNEEDFKNLKDYYRKYNAI